MQGNADGNPNLKGGPIEGNDISVYKVKTSFILGKGPINYPLILNELVNLTLRLLLHPTLNGPFYYFFFKGPLHH